MPNDEAKGASADEELSQEEMRRRVIQLAFGGDADRYQEFVDRVREVVPDDTEVVLRGSAVTGERWKDGAPFDADGPGTSDLDLTFVGDKVHELYILDGYFIPKVHSKPLSNDDPDIAPDLVPLRDELMAMVDRPVNIQATRDLVMYLRGDLMGQPYLVMIERANGS
jgi:hypothetical protein